MTDTLAALSAALADRYRLEREPAAGGAATVYPAAVVMGTALSSRHA